MTATAISRTGIPAWPVPPNPILGRDAEVGLLYELLTEDDVRLVTVVGPGGVGKTRLAIAVVEKLSTFGDENIVFVQLDSARDAEVMLEAIGAEIGVSEQEKTSLFETIVISLRDSSPLLVLDNLEQIADSAALLISQMLSACPGFSILATSRVPLNLRAERQFQLAPLSPPGNDDTDPNTNAALALFESRARAARADFHLTEQNLADTAEICRRLDGLPLAIELTAARSRLLSPAAILARLTKRLHVLDSGARDLPARQRTMQDAILWSYDLLTPVDQVTFRRLAIFPATFSLQAADEILSGIQESGESTNAGESIAALLDQSVLVVASSPEEEARLRMLQPIRDVALTLLDKSGETSRVSAAHARHFAQVATDIQRGLTEPALGDAIAKCERELPNLIAAIDWFASAGDGDGALTVAGGIWRFWYMRGRYSEGITCLKRALDTPGATATLRATALNGYGAHLDAVGQADAALAAYDEAILFWTEVSDQRGLAGTFNNRSLILHKQARYLETIAGFEQAASLLAALGDDWRAASVLDNIGLILGETGDHARAADHHARALATRRAIDDTHGMATSLNNLSREVAHRGDVTHALALADEARVIEERIGDRPGLAHTLIRLGFLAHKSGDLRTAESRAQEGLALYRELGQPQGVSHALHNLACTVLKRGEAKRALSLFRESLSLRREYGGPNDLVYTLQGFASVALASRQIALATQLTAAAAALADQIGAFVPPADEEIRAMRSELGERQFARLWEDGRVLSVDQAVELTELVSAVPGEEPKVSTPPIEPLAGVAPKSSDHGLTAREVDVLRLVAMGRTNADIGETLFISPYTAKTHVANLLGKLGVETRAAASTWAAQQGLL